jgi:hypothetical protein
MADLLSQDANSDSKINWAEKNFGQKFIDTATLGISSNMRNNNLRLAGINQQAADLENSPYNTASVTKENQDYYAKTAADYAKAKREAEFGFTPEQTAAARQTYAETTNLGAQNAMNAGGGTIANYINANLNANQNKFATGLASEDANLKMQKQNQVLNYLNQLGNAAGAYQDVATQNFNKNIMAEQAIGQAESDWYAQRDLRRKSLLDAGTNLVGTAVGLGIARNA